MKRIFFILLIAASAIAGAQEAGLTQRLEEHVTLLASDSLAGRAFGFEEKEMAVSYITAEFQKAGFAPGFERYIQNFDHKSGLYKARGKNIIGVIPGSEPSLSKEIIVIGAHYDHMGYKGTGEEKVIYNGADDNASGVASIIEIGKILMEHKSLLKRSIILVAFDGEEDGLHGSEFLAESFGDDITTVKAMFSLDMVGMYSKYGGVGLHGFNSLTGGKELALKVAELNGVKVKSTSGGIEMRTDTWSFGVRGVPSFYVSTGLLSPYHKPEDDSDLLDYPGMSKMVEFVSALAQGLASEEVLEPNNSFITKATDPKFLAGFKFGYGNSNHVYRDEFYDSKSLMALEAGMVVQFKITPAIYIQPGLSWEMTGAKTGPGKLRMHSFTPQMSLLFCLPPGDLSKPKSIFQAGYYYRQNFHSTLNGDGYDFASDYKDTDNGLILGFGFQYVKTQILFSYKYGLGNINLNPAGTDTRNRGFTASLVLFL